MKKIFYIVLIALLVIVPVFSTYAQTSVGQGNSGTIVGQGQAAQDSNLSVGFHLPNPLKANSLQCLVYDIVNGLMSILAIVAACYIIYSGFLFVAAQGSETKLTAAKASFFNAIIGTAILLGAWAITIFIVNVVQEVVADPNQLPNISGLSSSCKTK